MQYLLRYGTVGGGFLPKDKIYRACERVVPMHDPPEPPGSRWRAAPALLCAALFVAGGAYHLRALRYENGALRRAQAGKTAELALLRASDDRRFESYRAHVDALRTRHPRRRGNATAEHVPVGILVRTFAGDLQWLAYCLRSVAKFAQPYVDGVTVVFPEADDATVGAFVRLAHPWARTNVSTSAAVFAAAMRAAHPHKFARCHAGQCLPDYAAQIFDKLCADLYVPAARFVLHLDSDTVLTRPLAFSDVFDPRTRKPLMPRLRYAPGSMTERAWRAVTADLVGIKVEDLEFQFMTRQGLCYPHAFYGNFRRATERLHGRPLSEWLVDRFASTKGHPASEFEALGAFAYYRGGRDQFAWPEEGTTSFPALQKWSWGGLDDTLRLVLECVIAGASRPGNCKSATKV